MAAPVVLEAGSDGTLDVLVDASTYHVRVIRRANTTPPYVTRSSTSDFTRHGTAALTLSHDQLVGCVRCQLDIFDRFDAKHHKRSFIRQVIQALEEHIK